MIPMFSKKSTTKVFFSLVAGMLFWGCTQNHNTKDISSSDTNTSIDHNLSDDNNSHTVEPKIDLSYYRFKNNTAAYIPPQCYTKTTDSKGVHNPCFSCHTQSKAPNFVNDADVQASYTIADQATTNHWTNLFKDRQNDVQALDNTTITTYVNNSNYFDANGSIILRQKLLHALPKEWDIYPDGRWNGYVPDCYYNFDSQGFDHKPDGSYTLWRAFGYYPFLGTFWPTNGSTDDVLIRLPKYFAQDDNGDLNITIYHVNLSLVEMLTKQKTLDFDFNETVLGVDLNQDGLLTHITKLNLPASQSDIFFVGKAQSLLQEGKIEMDFGLFPLGTEFLHSVRYIKTDSTGNISLAPHMKELRYAKKTRWRSSEYHQILADSEVTEKIYYPNAVKRFEGHSEIGLNNKFGWMYQAFIEDKKGDLRPQNYEELTYCMGCHGMIGATTDSIFSFTRKFGDKSFQHGWQHWSQKGLKNVAEAIREDGHYEYTYYLQHNHAADEFRENTEVINKFFESNGSLKTTALDTLHTDISYLLNPSVKRAMELNKAYYLIVKEQSFIYGRDATISPVDNVLKSVVQDGSTGISDLLKGY